MAYGARTKGSRTEGFVPSAGAHGDLRGPHPLPRAGRRGAGLDGTSGSGAARLSARPRADRVDVPHHRRASGWPCPATGPSLTEDGRIVMYGRDSLVVNTGGEKVFVEEVEEVLRRHPAVADALVVGRPSERFGQEVVAVVAPVPGGDGRSSGAARVRGRGHRPLQGAPGRGRGGPRASARQRQGRLRVGGRGGPRRRTAVAGGASGEAGASGSWGAWPRVPGARRHGRHGQGGGCGTGAATGRGWPLPDGVGSVPRRRPPSCQPAPRNRWWR